MINRTDVTACAEQLRLVLQAIDSGQIDASPVQIAYIRGALDALEALRRHP